MQLHDPSLLKGIDITNFNNAKAVKETVFEVIGKFKSPGDEEE